MPVVGLAGGEFLSLCRQALETAGELRFRADGLSMRPALKPGDLLCVVPLRDKLPGRGDVIFAASPKGKPVAHRVIAARSRGGTRLYLTAGDALTHEPDPIIPSDNVLGVVIAYERDGERHAVPRVRHPVVQRLRAQWRLGLHATTPDTSPTRRLGHGIMQLQRKLSLAGVRLVRIARGWPLLGSVARAIWPDMGQRCRIEGAIREGGPGPRLYCFDALLRGRTVAVQLLCHGYGVVWAGLGDEDQWWLTNLHTRPLYQGRGITGRLLAEALRVAAEAGAEDLLAVIRPEETEPPLWFEKQGFRVLTDDELPAKLGANWRDALAAAGPATILYMPLAQPPA